MSFLNPVSEPVLRFKSTDAGAPQINYNARVAGDVKEVLKACLVTGYGAIVSAGWTAVNEVANVIEFVSPSVAMSDYRLGIDDTSTSSTTWYYQYQNARVNPTNNQPKKVLTYIDKTSINNGWELLVTNRGIYFVEKFFSTEVNSILGRTTYFGQVQSAVSSNVDKNIAFWCAGHGAAYNPYQFFSSGTTHFSVNSYEALIFASANIEGLRPISKTYANKAVDLISTVYLYKADLFIAGHPALLFKDPATNIGLYGVRDELIGDRPVIYICLGREVSLANVETSVRSILLYLDYWEY